MCYKAWYSVHGERVDVLKDETMNIDVSTIWAQMSPLLLKALGWAAVFLAPVKSVMLATIFLVGTDLVTGLYAAHKRSEKISSNGIRRTVTKTLAYMAAIICSHVMNLYFLDGVIDSVKIVSGLIAVTEFQSLMENLSSILKFDLWAAVLDKLQGKKIVPELKEQPAQLPEPEKEQAPALPPKRSQKRKKKRSSKQLLK